MTRYPIPADLWIRLGVAVLRSRPRRFTQDALFITAHFHAPVRILNGHNIPTAGAGVITCNHFAQPGFFAPLIAAAISSAIHQAGGRQEVCWVMTDTWTFPGSPLRGPLSWASHVILQRVARIYGFLSMPPMPPSPKDAMERARAVLQLVHYTREHPQALIGLAPEGADSPDGRMGFPLAGTGRLLTELCDKGMSIYPTGIYEESNQLTVQFGSPYKLPGSHTVDRKEMDLAARHIIWRAIAGCLPPNMTA